MKKRNKEERLRYSLHTLQKYCSFFLLMSFIITCCMLLFLNTMRKTMGLSLSEAGIGRAARITFLNIILLSLFWKRLTFGGTVAGIAAGAAVDILWLVFLSSTDIYEIVPGFAAGLLAAVVVSLLSKGPGKDVEDLFDRAVDLKS